jgi:hypothetical protein
MKTKLLLLSCAALILATGCGTYMKSSPTGKWDNPKNWEDIEVGMNVAQVRARLGRPPYMGEYDSSGYENWYYPNPEGGVVQITADRRVAAIRKPVWGPDGRIVTAIQPY